MLKPCLDCGEPTDQTRCETHRAPDSKPHASTRGYDRTWRKLSERARRLQPFCEDCGSVEDLQADHSPQAWERHNAGKPIRLDDISVVCGECNRRRGNARTRRDDPTSAVPRPPGKAKFASHTAAATA